MILERNAMLIPGLSHDVLDHPHRILMIESTSDQLWCIGIPKVHGNGRVAGYVTGPRVMSLALVSQAIVDGRIKQERFVAPGHWAMTDEDYLAEAPNEAERIRRRKRAETRDSAWESIAPLVENSSMQTLLHASALRCEVLKQARASCVSPVTIYKRLHLYWAHGSVRNGLMPSTHRCGGRGRERHVGKHRIGRPPKAFERGEMPTRGYILTETDKTRIGTAYGLVSPTVSRIEAYDLLVAAFFSDASTDAAGNRVYHPWKRHLRPSREQFFYWGARLARATHAREKYGINVEKKLTTHNGGSSQDLVAAVGQCAMFDATSTDVYLVSIYDRQVKLPPMTRSLLIEVRSTACIGLYCGWDAPSQATALQTLYCGATNKQSLCKRFGIDIGADDWPGMLCRINLADNGEMRGAATCEAEHLIGFGIEYAKTYFGPSKSDVESRHRTDHKLLDHRLPGSTRGKPRQRGVPHAADTACWNYFEYMRELLLHIIDYNNEEVRKLAPSEMVIAGIRPTRINILKWFRDHDQRADIACDLDQLRALTLPSWKAVMQHNGIILKTATGDRNLYGPRFFSDELRADERFMRAASTRVTEPITVHLQPELLSEVWLPSSRGLLRLPNVSSDELLKSHGTITDETQHLFTEAAYHDAHRQQEDEASIARTIRRQNTTIAAKREAKRQAREAPRRVSRKKQRANMRANAAAEQRAVGDGIEQPSRRSRKATQVAPTNAPSSTRSEPCRPMRVFLAELTRSRTTK